MILTNPFDRVLFAALVFILLAASSAPGQTKKPTSLAELAAYTGADREQLLLAGAKSEGKVVWYTSLAGGSYKAIVEVFETKYPGSRSKSTALRERTSRSASVRKRKRGAILPTHWKRLKNRLRRYSKPNCWRHLTRHTCAITRRRRGRRRTKSSSMRPSRANLMSASLTTKPSCPLLRCRKISTVCSTLSSKAAWLLGRAAPAGEIIGAMLKVKGDGFVKKLKAQEIRLFSMGSSAVRDQIAGGEIEAAPVIFRTHAIEAAEKGAPIEWLPMDLVPVHAGSAILAAHAPHPHAALLMVDFLSQCGRAKRAGKIQIRQRQPRTMASKAGTLQPVSAPINSNAKSTHWEKLVQSIVKKGG